MQNILIIGAGLSSSSLIRYLLNNSDKYSWKIAVVDKDPELVKQKLGNHPNGIALSFNALNEEERAPEIQKADLVISMLPARFHVEIAKDCLKYKTHLITPSYISKEMKALDEEVKKEGLIFMNEIGVDPGIDHMSALKVIDEIKAKGGELTAFKSFCGGLVAPESDNNPWNYKFTWNPRNVVLAGQGGAAAFIEKGEYKYIPYNRLFSRLHRLKIDQFGDFVGYANRDSLSYRSLYQLDDIPTMFRGTLRRPGFCQAWDVFVELGMTDDSYEMLYTKDLSPRAFLNAFLPYHPIKNVETKFKEFLREDRMHLFDKFEWLGLFETEPKFSFDKASPAVVLQKILENKLSLDEGDKDMLVMVHEFEYQYKGKLLQLTSHMVSIGEDEVYTAMSNTVGYPVAICAKLILTKQLTKTGVLLPVFPEAYLPILKELEEFNITFEENEKELACDMPAI